MKMTKRVLLICAVIISVLTAGSVFAADTFTVTGTVNQITSNPNMIVINDGGVLTEIYGIKFNYLARRYGVVIETGMEVSVEAFEYLCHDGVTRLKAAGITVEDLTVDLLAAGSRGYPYANK